MGYEGLTRRSLIKGAVASAAAVAALGTFGCAPRSRDNAAQNQGDQQQHSWEKKPDPITNVSSTVDTDVLIIGGGYSGTCCAVNAAQNGANVILVEKNSVLNGHGVGGTGAVKSRVMDQHNIVLDQPVEMERWVATCGNRCRESLVGKFFRESERCMNWLLDVAEADGASCMLTVGSNSTVHPEASDYHMLVGGNTSKDHTVADSLEYLFEKLAEDAGAQFVFESPAVQLVQDDDGKVTGAICQDKDGNYIQYNASKGVVLATGDISYDDEMLEYYAPIATKVMTRLCASQGNVGDGQKMAMWAGGVMQDRDWPTMMHPQAAAMFHGPFLFVNTKGERFMNEATWVQGKCVGILKNSGSDHAWSIFDSNWQTDLRNGLPYGGGMFWDTFRSVDTDYDYAVNAITKTVEDGLQQNPNYYKRCDSIDELAQAIDVDPTTLKNTIDRYNKMCDAGADTDFYKEGHSLTPIREAPYYALEVGTGLLAVCGGCHISDNFEVLNADDEPIPGLYAIGNCAGDIYAYDYPINIQGNSHARCLVEGKCLGEQLAGVYKEINA